MFVITNNVRNLGVCHGGQLGLKQVDLYLIHSPRLVDSRPGFEAAWRDFEALKKDGLAKLVARHQFYYASNSYFQISGALVLAISTLNNYKKS